MANILALDSFDKGQRFEFNSLIAEQNTFMNIFFKYASKDANTYYKDIFKGKSVDEVNRIRKVLFLAETKHNIISSIKVTLNDETKNRN